MNPRLHRGKLLIVTMALACGGPGGQRRRPGDPRPRPTRRLPWPLTHCRVRRTSRRIRADHGNSSRQAGPGPARPRGREGGRGNGPPVPAALRLLGCTANRCAAAPARRGPGRGHLRPSGIDSPDSRRLGVNVSPMTPGPHRADVRGHRGRHGRLADHPDRRRPWWPRPRPPSCWTGHGLPLDGRGRHVMTRLPSGHQVEPRDSRRGMTAHGTAPPGRRPGETIMDHGRTKPRRSHDREPDPRPAGRPRALPGAVRMDSGRCGCAARLPMRRLWR